MVGAAQSPHLSPQSSCAWLHLDLLVLVLLCITNLRILARRLRHTTGHPSLLRTWNVVLTYGDFDFMVTHHMPKTSYEHIGVRETGAAVALEKMYGTPMSLHRIDNALRR